MVAVIGVLQDINEGSGEFRFFYLDQDLGYILTIEILIYLYITSIYSYFPVQDWLQLKFKEN